MAYKLLYYKPVYLLSTLKVGSITALYNDEDDHLICCWGTDIDGYTWCDFGVCTPASLKFYEYEDSWIACLYISEFSNSVTVKAITDENLDCETVYIDTNFIAIGIAPSTAVDGYQETKSSGTISISRQRYTNWVRDKGHLLSAAGSGCTLALDPKVFANFFGISLIANYVEMSLVYTEGNVIATTTREEARVRWGDLSSSYCQIIQAEADGSVAGTLDLTESPGPITAACVLSDRVVIFKPDMIYELVWSGAPTYFTQTPTVSGNGTQAPQSVKQLGATTCSFWGTDGLYIYSIGGEVKRISDRMYEYFKETYTKEQLKNVVCVPYLDRDELWVWVKGTDSIVYKCNLEVYDYNAFSQKVKHYPWMKTDYSSVIGSDLVHITKALDTKQFVPHLFFDEDDALTLANSETEGYKKLEYLSYYDRQSSYDSVSSYIETKDFPLGVDSRVTELLVQLMSDVVNSTIFVSYSTDEGRSYSSEVTVRVDYTPDFMWYSIPIDITCESIRFKLRTLHPISIGSLKIKGSPRRRGSKE